MIKILILGGGFGGIRTALDLNKKLGHRKDVSITLVDRNNYQTFYPSLYEIAAAYGITHNDPYNVKLRSTIAIPLAEIFAKTQVHIIQGEISQVDINKKQVHTQGEQTLDFDYLVIAFGSEVSTYGIPGVMEYAYKFKTVDDALLLFKNIEEHYRHIDQARLPVKFLVVGAGFTGIELAAELSLCTAHIARKHKVSQDRCTQLALIEAAPQILPMIPSRERELIKKRLEHLDIEIIKNSAIAEIVDQNSAKLKTGQIMQADFIVWSAGVKAPNLLRSIAGLELDLGGRILVNDFLQTLPSVRQAHDSEQPNHNVFAVGDNLIFHDSDSLTKARSKPIPQLAFLAIKQGSLVAENITRLINGPNSKLVSYIPAYETWIAPVGGKHAVVHTQLLTFDGLLGYLFRELIDARYFISVLPLYKALKLMINRFWVFIKND